MLLHIFGIYFYIEKNLKVKRIKGDKMTDFQKDFLKVFFDSFENEDIKVFAQNVIAKLPDYWWTENASSSGKYHPSYVMPPSGGGLFIHSSAVFVFLNYALGLEMWKNKLSLRRNLCMWSNKHCKDSCKKGINKQYHTKQQIHLFTC